MRLLLWLLRTMRVGVWLMLAWGWLVVHVWLLRLLLRLHLHHLRLMMRQCALLMSSGGSGQEG
jgi:hypothetical protein